MHFFKFPKFWSSWISRTCLGTKKISTNFGFRITNRKNNPNRNAESSPVFRNDNLRAQNWQNLPEITYARHHPPVDHAFGQPANVVKGEGFVPLHRFETAGADTHGRPNHDPFELINPGDFFRGSFRQLPREGAKHSLSKLERNQPRPTGKNKPKKHQIWTRWTQKTTKPKNSKFSKFCKFMIFQNWSGDRPVLNEIRVWPDQTEAGSNLRCQNVPHLTKFTFDYSKAAICVRKTPMSCRPPGSCFQPAKKFRRQRVLRTILGPQNRAEGPRTTMFHRSPAAKSWSKTPCPGIILQCNSTSQIPQNQTNSHVSINPISSGRQELGRPPRGGGRVRSTLQYQ